MSKFLIAVEHEEDAAEMYEIAERAEKERIERNANKSRSKVIDDLFAGIQSNMSREASPEPAKASQRKRAKPIRVKVEPTVEEAAASESPISGVELTASPLISMSAPSGKRIGKKLNADESSALSEDESHKTEDDGEMPNPGEVAKVIQPKPGGKGWVWGVITDRPKNSVEDTLIEQSDVDAPRTTRSKDAAKRKP